MIEDVNPIGLQAHEAVFHSPDKVLAGGTCLVGTEIPAHFVLFPDCIAN